MSTSPHFSTPTGGGSEVATTASYASTAVSAGVTARSKLQEFWSSGDDYAPLALAGDAILKCLRDDEARPDADLYRRIATTSAGGGVAGVANGKGAAVQSSPAPVSAAEVAAAANTNTSDNGGYRLGSAAGSLPQNASPVPGIVHVRSVPLPSMLREKLRTGSKRYSFMGILAPVRMGWMSIDDSLWLWKIPAIAPMTRGGSSVLALPASQQQPQPQLQGDSLAGSDEPPVLFHFQVPTGQPIVTVALVPPKPGTCAD
jgi:hypothetical protein